MTVCNIILEIVFIWIDGREVLVFQEDVILLGTQNA